VPGMAELFDLDLANGTLTRVTRGYEGGPSERPHLSAVVGKEDSYEIPTDGALSPSFSGNGDMLAFSSTASNLVFGDGNTPAASLDVPQGSADGSDVFVAQKQLFTPEPVETYVGTPPANPSVTPEWRLGVTAQSLSDGDVRLYLEVPGAGSLSASVSGVLEAHTSARASRSRGHGKRARGKRARGSAALVLRTIASTMQTVAASAGGLVELTLTLAPSYRTLAARTGGLSGTATVAFTGAGGPTLRQSIVVSFASKASPSHERAQRASHAKRKARHP
jgi:hypothetical protein